MARYTAEGELVWAYDYGGDGDDLGRDIIATQDEGFSIVGATSSYSAFTEAWHLKIDGDGDEEWYWNWGQVNDQESFEHVQIESGHFIAVGYTRTTGAGGKDLFLLKSNSDGSFNYGQTFGGVDDDEGYSISLLEDGVICGGYTKSFGAGGDDYFIMRADLNIQTASVFVNEAFDPVSIDEVSSVGSKLTTYPNPSSGSFTIDGVDSVKGVELYDLTGRLVRELDILSSPLYTTGHLSSGTYVIKVTTRDMVVFQTRILIIDP